MLSDIMVKLMRQYLPEKGIDVIDHKHIEQARYQMKQTYKWGGTEAIFLLFLGV